MEKAMSFFQDSLFATSTAVKIAVNEDHELVQLSNLVPWQTLVTLAMTIRSKKVKKESGPQPHYRQLLGAVALMAVKNLTYRDAEDLIAHYAPARYLCDLMDSDWAIDHVTIFEFTQMLGSTGMEQINHAILMTAHDHGVIDPRQVMSDTTAQEAKIPYPTEVGLMARFMELTGKNVKKLGGKFNQIKASVKKAAKEVKHLLRNSNLFAKTKEQKRKVGKKMYHQVKNIHKEIQGLLASGYKLSSKAGKDLTDLVEVMDTLLPQMLHFIETGFVAAKKVIHLQMPELYSIVRQKAGKRVEFGLKWGINRIAGGFVQGFLVNGGEHRSDKKFCLEGVDQHLAVFGEPPKIYGYDRGGYSQANIKKLKKRGVKHVGVAPKGGADWATPKTMTEKIKRERAQVEGSIGTLKSNKYGFNKPTVCSTEAMARCGHRSITGFNLMKLVKEVGKLQIANA
jgi:IS5 family transposase